MLKLFLYVIPSGLDNADVDKTIGSFTYIDEDLEEEVGLLSGWTRASNMMEIARLRKMKIDDDWYIILYDNECVSIGLAHGLRIRMSFLEPDADVLIACKKYSEHSMVQAPRIFRSFVNLPEESLMPDKEAKHPLTNVPLRYDRMLDGWIYDQDSISKK